MDSLFKMLERRSNFKHDRIALDLEVAGINTKSRITSTTLNCLEICKARTGRYPMVYSRANWVNTYLSVKDLPKLDWWLATYRKTAPSPLYTREHPGPPPICPKALTLTSFTRPAINANPSAPKATTWITTAGMATRTLS